MENNDENHKTLKERVEFLEGRNRNKKKRKFFIPFKSRVGRKNMKIGRASCRERV